MSNEFERIARLTTGLPGGSGVLVGAGDDAAVLRPRDGRDLVATTDAFVEGRHYRMDLIDATTLGRRLAAANLSDIAAMGAEPRWALLSLVLPATLDESFVEQVQHACAAWLAASGAAIVGGNLAATDGPAVWTVTLLGEVERGRAWTRAGARAGDAIAVTGWPGRAAAVLAATLSGNPPSWRLVPDALCAHWSAPPSRVAAARALAATGGVTACIDVSDGFTADLAQLAKASHVDVELDDAAWPDDPLQGAAAANLADHLAKERAVARVQPAATLEERFRFAPGDDYELILAIDPTHLDAVTAAARATNTPLHVVGRCASAGEGTLTRIASDGARTRLSPEGWDHFG